MLNIYLTRHGETVWNQEGRLQGSKDSQLTEVGERNAILLGERLADIDFNRIYSSSSGRALKTAQLICQKRDIPIETIENLKEIYFGEWEGKTQLEIDKQFKNQYHAFWNTPHNYDHLPHKAESLRDFKSRIEQALEQILETNSDGNILIVTHGVVIRAMMSYFWDIPSESMWDPPFISGASFSLICWDGNAFQKEVLGDTTHME